MIETIVVLMRHPLVSEFGIRIAEKRKILTYGALFRLAYAFCSAPSYETTFKKVSFSIRLDARGQRRRSYETTFQKLELVLSWATLHFVGWVEPTPGFVGFRCTQPNLHFAGVITKCETQQRLISELSSKSFFSLRPPFFGWRRR